MLKKGGVNRITQAAMMVALSVIIGIFCKSFLNFGAGLFRITFENIPIIMSGIIMGPLTGGIVGASSDLLSYFLSAQSYPPNLIVTLGATMVGVCSGLVSKFLIKRRGSVQIILSGSAAHIVGSMIIKPIGLFQFYQYAVLFRIPLYLVIAPLEIGLICALLKRRSFARVVGYVDAMKKDEAIKYIHSVSWTFCKPGLERIEELTRRMNNPQHSLKFIHVAGTNGKGSFCSMMSSVLVKNGYRVGLFTSPYIEFFNERMQINGVPISDSELSEITEKIKPIADSMADKPTEFELVTAIALEYFSRNRCDYVVFECGLGGRLDSTNIISTPILSVITGIDLDHTSILGDTKEAIAKEKAGIIKEGIPCLWCGEQGGAEDVISASAKEKNAPFYTVDRSRVNVKSATLGGTFFDFHPFTDINIALLGNYQIINASNVLAAVGILRDSGVKISDEAVRQGMSAARWRARFEKLLDEPTVIFDGGHNPQGVDFCVQSYQSYFGEKKAVVVTGVMADKDYGYIADRICRVAHKVYCITPDNPRALDSCKYAEEFKSRGVDALGCEAVSEAVFAAVEEAKKASLPVLCLGSLYMYSEIAGAVKASNSAPEIP